MDFEEPLVVFELLVLDADFSFGSVVDAAAPLLETDADFWVFEALADELSDEGVDVEESNQVLQGQ